MTEHRVGVVTHFFSRLRVATVRLEEPVKLGDSLLVKGARDAFRVRVKSMQVNHAPVEHAEAGMEVGIKVPAKAHEGDVVLRAEPRKGWLARLLGR